MSKKPNVMNFIYKWPKSETPKMCALNQRFNDGKKLTAEETKCTSTLTG